MDTHQLIDIVFKLSDLINFNWNFYVVVCAIILGWLFTSDIQWDMIKRIGSSIGFIVFTIINGRALNKAYVLLNTTLEELKEKDTYEVSTFMQQFVTQGGIGDKGVIYIHTVMGIIILGMIWFYSSKKDKNE